MFERLDAHARNVFVVAQHQARDLGHNYVGTEHVLLALARAGGATADLLANQGCGPEAIRAEIVSLLGPGRSPSRQPDELLASIGVDLGEVRRRVEATFGPEAISHAAMRTRRRRRRWPVIHRWWPGCDQGTPCNSALLDRRRFGFAPRLKAVLEIATKAAAPTPVSPAHLLLGILDEGKGVACQILARRSIDIAGLGAAARAAASRADRDESD
jgi:ATP-dependent Clp protease ATP-binding subunit ClpA